jgi:hypothetical protein
VTADLVTVFMGRVRETKPERATRVVMRAPARKTHCKRGHEFTVENTRLSPEGWKACRTCERARDRLRDPARKKDTPTVKVRCSECGDNRVLSSRQARRIALGETTGKCELCLREPPVVVTDALERWWLRRFSLAEIREMAAALETTLGRTP